jgi:3-(3-hydroxy-phenyl)propionate hydroxylase
VGLLHTHIAGSLDRMSAENEHEVVVAGAGPTGLMLAGELALGGVDVVIVELRETPVVDGSRAGGLHIRTLEVLDQRGIAERFVDAGHKYPALGYAYIQLDLSDLPTRHNYLLALKQSDFEPMLANWVEGLGVRVLRGREVVGFAQDANAVDVNISDGTKLWARYLVGCDGGRSVVRKAAGIDFAGFDASTSFIIAEAEMTESPVVGIRPEGGGIGPVDPASPGGPYGIVLKERHADRTAEPTVDELRAAMIAAYGTDFGVHSPTRISHFSDISRQAVEYRKGRVLLAGDAAHIHAPLGGQGLNTGVQDAVNLGWKLSRVVNGESPDSLLDTYHAERHPVGARVLDNTMAQTALVVADDRHKALHAAVARWLALDEPRKQVSAMIAGLDIRYDTHAEVGGDHPLVGRRMPDLDVHTADGLTRVFALLHTARPVLLNLGAFVDFDVSPWPGVRMVDARCDGPWELPVLGEVAAPTAVLIRPDGYVAWTGDLADPDLSRALATWFGPRD